MEQMKFSDIVKMTNESHRTSYAEYAYEEHNLSRWYNRKLFTNIDDISRIDYIVEYSTKYLSNVDKPLSEIDPNNHDKIYRYNHSYIDKHLRLISDNKIDKIQWFYNLVDKGVDSFKAYRILTEYENTSALYYSNFLDKNYIELLVRLLYRGYTNIFRILRQQSDNDNKKSNNNKIKYIINNCDSFLTVKLFNDFVNKYDSILEVGSSSDFEQLLKAYILERSIEYKAYRNIMIIDNLVPKQYEKIIGHSIPIDHIIECTSSTQYNIIEYIYEYSSLHNFDENQIKDRNELIDYVFEENIDNKSIVQPILKMICEKLTPVFNYRLSAHSLNVIFNIKYNLKKKDMLDQYHLIKDIIESHNIDEDLLSRINDYIVFVKEENENE